MRKGDNEPSTCDSISQLSLQCSQGRDILSLVIYWVVRIKGQDEERAKGESSSQVLLQSVYFKGSVEEESCINCPPLVVSWSVEDG